MIVKTWNEGSYNVSGAGHGVKISKLDREKFFNKSWRNVRVYLENKKEYSDIVLRSTFWTTCCELRSNKIGKYLIDNRLEKCIFL